MTDDDFKFLDKIFSEACDKRKIGGEGALGILEGIVYFIWGAFGVIENGGFSYFFENGMNADSVATSLDAIGRREDADLFLKANRLRMEGRPFKNWKSELQFLDAHEKELEEWAEEFISHEEEICSVILARICGKGR